jgi:eukaryotic-like serine/threonine-protein kinase
METPDPHNQATVWGTTQARHRKVGDLFLEALERAPNDRAEFLDYHCEDEAIRREVEAMLNMHALEGEILDSPVLAEGLEAAANRSASAHNSYSLIGSVIGKCHVMREIGRGGMGVVYEARRIDLGKARPVALKVLKRGMDTDAIVRRFRREYRILASLEHPNIARLLDGGVTEDGTPFFLMDFIEGKPIVAYCDERRLSVGKRLELFRKVCDAVQYAHRNLIVHRDIKPSNILVTDEGVPKLLDFGIAKVLRPDGDSGENAMTEFEVTQAGRQAMTPAYASPEQMRGENVTTAMDIYALGVLLYELLTGRFPYRLRKGTLDELRAAICDAEPERPSAAVLREADASDAMFAPPTTANEAAALREGTPERLSRRLAGDIDKIVLKSLSKEPSRRFASVEQFSEDIQRHLDGLPVTAQTDDFVYRAGKFVRRNRVSLTAGALIVCSVLGGGTAAAWQKVRAERERSRAEAQRRLSEALVSDVRDMANTLLYKIHDQVEKLPGSTPVRETMVKEALTYLDRLNRQAGAEPTLQREVALAYRRVGDVQGRPYVANLGDTSGALESYQKSLALLESFAAANPDDADAQAELATAYERTGEALGRMGDSSGAMERYAKTQSMRERLAAAHPENAEYRRTLADCYTRIGDEMRNAEDLIGALELYRKVLTMRRELLREEPENDRLKQNLATVQLRLAVTLESLGDVGKERIGTGVWTNEIYRQALEYQMEVLDFTRSATEKDADNPAKARDLNGGGYLVVGKIFLKLEKGRDALSNLQKALEGMTRLSVSDPKNVEYQVVLAQTQGLIGAAFEMLGDAARSDAAYQKAFLLYEKLSAQDEANDLVHRQFAELHMRLGKEAFSRMRFPEAAEHFQKTLKILERSTTDKAAASHRDSAKIAPLYAATLIKSGKVESGRTALAREIARYKLQSETTDIPTQDLTEYAWTLISSPDVSGVRNVEEGLRCAQRAAAKSGERSVSALLTLAAAQFANEDGASAQKTTKKLVELLPCDNARQKEAIFQEIQKRYGKTFQVADEKSQPVVRRF